MAFKKVVMNIGIITIHRLLNYGTALQAFALEYYLNSIENVNAEIIDYKFPNEFHKNNHSLYKRIKIELGAYREYFNGKREKKNLFIEFRNKFMRLGKYYSSVEDVMSDSPEYDIYVTGSDQVWNYKILKNDPVMFCAFAKQGKRKLSFGSSFANESILQSDISTVKQYLNTYSALGVRERFGINLLNQLGVDSTIPKQITCDPTLLLESKEYDMLAEYSRFKPNKDYILCYALDYAFNPQPVLNRILKIAEEYWGCSIIQLGRKRINYDGHIEYVNNIGPCEFLYLVKHSKYVIASSFHGCIFSMIYRKPFVAIGPANDNSDKRIIDMLSFLGISNAYTRSNEFIDKSKMQVDYNDFFEDKLQQFVTQSKDFLLKSINFK